MNEYVHVTFLVENAEVELLKQQLEKHCCHIEFVEKDIAISRHSNAQTEVELSARVPSIALSALKLTDPHLCRMMHISYISSQLKDQYRRKN